jgi:hypothetical protein
MSASSFVDDEENPGLGRPKSNPAKRTETPKDESTKPAPSTTSVPRSDPQRYVSGFDVAASNSISSMLSDIDLSKVAKHLTEWLVRGTQLRTIDISRVTVFPLPYTKDEQMIKNKDKLAKIDPRWPRTMTECLNTGMKFFDSVVYLSLSDPKYCNYSAYDDAKANEYFNDETKKLNIIRIAKLVAVVYFHLLTRASYPSGRGTDKGTDIPAFQIQLLDAVTSGSKICNELANFDLKDLDGSWIRYINIGAMGKEFVNRLALGVAGYRNIMPFKYYQPDLVDAEGTVIASREGIKASQFLKNIADAPYDWNIHPLTRSASMVKDFGSLNQNAQNIMLEIYSDKTLTEMVKSKMIYRYPTYMPQYIQWKNWSIDTPVDLRAPMFL